MTDKYDAVVGGAGIAGLEVPAHLQRASHAFSEDLRGADSRKARYLTK